MAVLALKILGVHNQGNQLEEFVLLQALADVDIGPYGIADSTYVSASTISNRLRHTYWFPDKKVSKGALILLRTCEGKDGPIKYGDQPAHRFFWGLKTSVWNDTGDCAVLLRIDGHKFFAVPAAPKKRK